jgi:hypothetical protein
VPRQQRKRGKAQERRAAKPERETDGCAPAWWKPPWAQKAPATPIYLCAQYRRIVKRRGHRRAVIAVAHTILVIAYPVIRDQKMCRELGKDYFEKRDKSAIERRCARQLERLGFDVTLATKDSAA